MGRLADVRGPGRPLPQQVLVGNEEQGYGGITYERIESFDPVACSLQFGNRKDFMYQHRSFTDQQFLKVIRTFSRAAVRYTGSALAQVIE